MQSASRLQWMGLWTELACYTHCSNTPLGLLLNDADDEKEEEEEDEEKDKGRSYSHFKDKI